MHGLTLRSRASSLVASLVVVGCFHADKGAETEGGSSSGTAGTGSTSASSTSASSAATGTSQATTANTTTASTSVTSTSTATTSTTAPPTSGTGDSGSGTSGGPPPSCGDGTVNPGEACDDGVNAGAQPGDCAPDCSKTVEEKVIRLSQSTVTASFALGQASIAAAADAQCPSGYKAMIADGVSRVGSLAPLMGNGQVDWPIQSWTSYVNSAGDTVWTTTELTLLGVADDHTWAGLQSPVSGTTLTTAFTGLVEDYTTSALNCVGFTVDAGMSGQDRVAFGRADLTDLTAIGTAADSGGSCGSARYFYCIEQ